MIFQQLLLDLASLKLMLGKQITNRLYGCELCPCNPLLSAQLLFSNNVVLF